MKTVITILFGCFGCLFAYSQRTVQNDFEKENFFRVGFNAGFNINKIQGRSFKDDFRYNYDLRGFLQFNFSRKFGLQPEVTFIQASSEESDDFSDIYDDIALQGDQLKAKLNYLQFGSMLNLNVGPTQRIKLQLGPQWGILLSEHVDSLKTPRDIFKNGDFSIAGGIMIQLPFVHIGGRFAQGLTNINDIDDRDKWKNQSFQLFAGITF
ncbi:MAG TPA: porin family protein [Chitinophagaceae bacterium]